ncbi:MAG: hypothetical protein KKH98_03135 [Spirochaetes bacterium]|nr:hypothetical protein [Spirochaetota bacterium]
MKRTLWIIFISIFIAGSLSAAIKVGPSHTTVSVDPEKKVVKEIYLENTSDKPTEIVVTVENFRSSKINEKVDWRSWLTIDTKNIILKGNEKILLQYTLEAFKDFKGEVSAKVSFIDRPSGSSTSIRTKMSVAIYMISRANAKIGSELGKMNIEKEGSLLNFQVPVKNTGNIHVRPDGHLSLLNSKGKVLNKVELKTSYPIFEGYEIKLENKEQVKFPGNGEYTVNVKLNLGYKDIYNVEKDYKVSINKKGKIKIREKK